MNKQAFFFQGDSLLLPSDFPETRIDIGIPLELTKEFSAPEVFEIPAIDEPGPIITAVSIPEGEPLPDTWKSYTVRQLIAMPCNASLNRIIRAFHVARWRQESRFCGTCGAKNDDVPAQTERACPNCGRLEFPRICPAVIVIITDDENKILMAHNKRFRKGLYSHISGFNEAGESLEETVVREVREEININIKDIEYVKSQPWPFPNSLMLGFKARYASGTIMCDGDEIEDAKWFTKDSLPELPTEGSLSRLLINCWLEGSL